MSLNYILHLSVLIWPSARVYRHLGIEIPSNFSANWTTPDEIFVSIWERVQ